MLPASSPVAPSQPLHSRYEHAVTLARSGDVLRGEQQLRLLLREHPGHSPAAFFLATLLSEQGRFNAAADVIGSLVASATLDADIAGRSAQLLEQTGHAAAALAVLERAMPGVQSDALPLLRFHAGRLSLSLGDFSRARELLLAAANGAPAPLARHIVHALSTTLRYSDPAHPDFALFRKLASDPAATDDAKASALFALGKACDDIDDTQGATDAWRQANALVSRHSSWSSKSWRRFVKARLQATPIPALQASFGFTPVFIVGLPRTGTTLVSELLARHPEVAARGELTWIEHIAGQLVQHGAAADVSVLRQAASIYAAQLVRDDPPARWYIDKQPLNWRYLDLIAALFPQAKIVHCVRGERDTALSIWGQYFAGDGGGFAYDLQHIAEVMHDSERLMVHWSKALPLAIHTIRYEDLAERPQPALAALQEFLGLPPLDMLSANAKSGSVIHTASAWQARQPIYRRSVGRWLAYADLLPELKARFAS